MPNLYAGLAIRSEAASARLSSPVSFQSRQWSIGDIVDYQSDGVMALLRRVALDRVSLLKNFQAIAAQSVVPRPPEAAAIHSPFCCSNRTSRNRSVRLINDSTPGLRDVAGSEEEMHQEVRGALRFSNRRTILEFGSKIFLSVGRSRSASWHSENRRGRSTARDGAVQCRRAIISSRNAHRSASPALARPLRASCSRRARRLALPQLLNVRTVSVDSEFSYHAVPEPPSIILQGRVRENGGVRVGIYRNHLPAVDEGWTRWIFDQYRFGYQSISRE
jgi:hypothetical protein